MFASTALCYMDRQTIALVRPNIETEFGVMSDETFGWVVAAFMLPYALFQVPAGFLADRGDIRRIYALAVGGWSLAGVAAAFSPSLGALIAFRVCLGVGESFNWPCGLRLTSRILPPSDRGLGNGIFNSGAAVGAVVAPLTIPLIAQAYGWRAAFASVGALGFVWVAVWLAIRPGGEVTYTPRMSETPGRLTNTARSAFAALVVMSVLIAVSAIYLGPNALWVSLAVLMFGVLVVARILPASDLSGSSWSAGLSTIVRLRRFWVMVIVAITVNVCWHYLVNWMGTFFQTPRKLGMVQGARVAALPFLAADLGNVLGGWLSRSLSHRGMTVFRSRLTIMGAGAGLVACGTTVGLLRDTTAIVIILMIVAMGATSVMANYFALCQDVSPRHTGLVVGILGGLGNLFAAGFMPLAGRIQDVTKGFGTSFAIVGLLPMVGVLALRAGWGRDAAIAEEAP